MKIHAYAKVNIFLKITGLRNGYHELRSRFVLVEDLYDTLMVVRKRQPREGLEISSSVPIPKENTITRAYDLIRTIAPRVETFFRDYQIVLTKRIPQGAGLGGGSSDAAAFLNFCNEVLQLKLAKKKLALMGERIGADVPFFVYGYPSANVSGIGEKIVPFEEEPPKLELYTPPIHCDTAAVYATFRQEFKERIDPFAGASWLETPSRELLATLVPEEANDLYPAALHAYPRLADYRRPGWFFSGSGSTFFTLKKV
ncbi:4-(cytidine 5'-diphospho)-2-C-methyl-D-erythritol kinase [Hydrogenimonas sp.]